MSESYIYCVSVVILVYQGECILDDLVVSIVLFMEDFIILDGYCVRVIEVILSYDWGFDDLVVVICCFVDIWFWV